MNSQLYNENKNSIRNSKINMLTHKFVNTSTILTILLLLSIPYTLISQNKDKYLEIELPPIETISTLTPKKLSETSYDVHIITRKEIEEKGFTTISDIVKSINASISREYGNKGMASSPSFRAATTSHTLVLIDGKRLNIPSLGLVDPNKIPLVVDNIERIEILKGPSSALYGSEAIGGVINIVTKNAEKNYVYTSSYFGSFETFHKEVYASFKKDKIGVAVGLMHENSEGFRENSEYEIKSLNTKLQYFLTNENIITFNLDMLSSNAGSPGPTFFPSPNANFSELNTLLGINYSSPTLSINSFLHSFASTFISDFENTVSRNFVYSFDLKKTLKLSEGLNIIGGIELANEKLNSIDHLNLAGSIGKKSRGRVGALSQIDWNVTPKIEVIAGSRYDNIGGKDQISPRASVSFKPSENLIFGLNYAHGFRTPTFSELFWPDTIFFVGNPNLKPEVSDEYELLAKYSSGIYNGKVSIFQRNTRDLIVNVPDDTFKFSPVNLAKTKTIGLGLDNYLRFKKLDIGLSLDYFDPEDKTNNKKVRFAPKFLTKYYLTYHISKNLTLSAQYYFTQQYVVNAGDPSTYDTIDFKLSQKIKIKNTEGEIFLIGKNVLDRDFQYQVGYPYPGAQFYSGFSLQF